MQTDSTPDPGDVPMISAIVLAAGSSRRMGRSKMLLPWRSSVVIDQVIEVLLAGGVQEPVVVTGHEAQRVRAMVQAKSVRWVNNENYATQEMLDSLQLGIPCLPTKAQAFLIVLGDQPQFDAGVVKSLIDQYTRSRPFILIPSYRMRRGHPWLVKNNLTQAILALPKGATLRQFLQQHEAQIEYLVVESAAILKDLDTPLDYAQQKPEGTNEP